MVKTPEEKREYFRKYYKNHRERILSQKEKYYNKKRLIILDKAKGWDRKNRIHYLKQKKEYDTTKRSLILKHYGNKCQCCGETRYEFLAIDHINNDGNIKRKIHGSGHTFYSWIIKNRFPDYLQILCHNCNTAKGVYGQCPHEKEKMSKEQKPYHICRNNKNQDNYSFPKRVFTQYQEPQATANERQFSMFKD